MLEIILATHNAGKREELQKLLGLLPIKVLEMREFPYAPSSSEPYSTYLENARDKAKVVADYSGKITLAEDSGLAVKVLHGRPGVHSSRYAGDEAKAEDNIRKLLEELRDFHGETRAASFHCCMLLYDPHSQNEWVSYGELKGYILERPQGSKGFGYDPIFALKPQGESLATFSSEEKNRISHRSQALAAMQEQFLKLASVKK